MAGRAVGVARAEGRQRNLDDAPLAYRDLAHGNVRGRAVVVPNDSFSG